MIHQDRQTLTLRTIFLEQQRRAKEEVLPLTVHFHQAQSWWHIATEKAIATAKGHLLKRAT
jgi:hypothetical protein